MCAEITKESEPLKFRTSVISAEQSIGDAFNSYIRPRLPVTITVIETVVFVSKAFEFQPIF